MLPGQDALAGPALRPEPSSLATTVAFEAVDDPAAASDPAPPPAPAPRVTAAAPAVAARPAVDPFAPPVMAPRVIVAAERVMLNRPIDLTHLTSVTGATAVAGAASVALPGGTGAGAPSGSGGGAAGASAAAAGGGQGTTRTSLAEPARPTGRAWRCPWPDEAVAAELYRQNILVRVTVGADGSPQRATAQSNPGFGFAAAAEACAMRQPYSAARDDQGQPIPAVTPAIQVEFRR